MYRLWGDRRPAIIVYLVVSMTLWALYLQFTWVTLPELEFLSIISICLAVENYFVNVKLRAQGMVEMNPIWRGIEERFDFKYSCPLVVSGTLAAVWVWGSYLGEPLWVLTVCLSVTLPAFIFASVNDILVFLDGAMDVT